jgi:hypothetical protein
VLCAKCALREEIRRNVLSWLVSWDRLICQRRNPSTYHVRSSRRWRPAVRDKKENFERKGFEVRLKYFLRSVICFLVSKNKKKGILSRQSVGQRIMTSHPLLSRRKTTPSHPSTHLPLGYRQRQPVLVHSLQVLQDGISDDPRQSIFTLPFLYLSLRPHVIASTPPCN